MGRGTAMIDSHYPHALRAYMDDDEAREVCDGMTEGEIHAFLQELQRLEPLAAAAWATYRTLTGACRPDRFADVPPDVRGLWRAVAAAVLDAQLGGSATRRVSRAERGALWDAIAQVCELPDPQVMTKSERADVGKTVTELAAAGASPGVVVSASQAWMERYRLQRMSVHALRNRWGQVLANAGLAAADGADRIQAKRDRLVAEAQNGRP